VRWTRIARKTLTENLLLMELTGRARQGKDDKKRAWGSW